jgi:predicted RNase H-like HicB family nuclease
MVSPAPDSETAMPHTIAFVHEEEGHFGISFPDFPGCIAGGRSLDEAVLRGTEALAAHVAVMAEFGDPMPRLRGRAELLTDPEAAEAAADAVLVAVPVDLPGRAVRVNVSLDEHLLKRIDASARAAGQSRSAYLAAAAEEKIRHG